MLCEARLTCYFIGGTLDKLFVILYNKKGLQDRNEGGQKNVGR